MSEFQTVRGVFLDDEGAKEATALFGTTCTDETEVYADESNRLVVRVEQDPDRVFKAMTTGSWSADVLILDVNFEKHAAQRLQLADRRSNLKFNWGIDVLATIKRIDPDFPVVMLTAREGHTSPFQAGRVGADEFMAKAELEADTDEGRKLSLRRLLSRIRHAMRNCSERAIYDHQHLETADQFAPKYDEGERTRLATVAYYHYENDLILRAINQLLPEIDDGRRLRILDVGCGTGRIEELLVKHPQRARLEVIGIDFSGKMIGEAHDKLITNEHCCLRLGFRDDADPGDVLAASLFRAPAERLNFVGDVFPDGFDLIILGFGFLSYVRYNDVIVPVGQRSSSAGVIPLMREGGRLLFSVYNEDSAIYDRIARLDYEDRELPIAAIMDPVSGFLRVAESHRIACQSFTVNRMQRFLRQGGLTLNPDEVSTFPTLHLMLNQSDGNKFPEDTEFPTGDRENPYARFSLDHYRLDIDVSRVMPNRGHYVVGLASKF